MIDICMAFDQSSTGSSRVPVRGAGTRDEPLITSAWEDNWCADYSKYRGFLAGGISTASSLRPFLGSRLRR